MIFVSLWAAKVRISEPVSRIQLLQQVLTANMNLLEVREEEKKGEVEGSEIWHHLHNSVTRIFPSLLSRSTYLPKSTDLRHMAAPKGDNSKRG